MNWAYFPQRSTAVDRRFKSYAFGGIVAVVQIRLLKFNTYVNLLYFKESMMLGIFKSYVH